MKHCKAAKTKNKLSDTSSSFNTLFFSAKAATFGPFPMKHSLRQTIGRWVFAVVLVQMLNIALGYDNIYHFGKSVHHHQVDLQSGGILSNAFDFFEDALRFMANHMPDVETEEEKKSTDPELLENPEMCAEDWRETFPACFFTETSSNSFIYHASLTRSFSELNSPPPKHSV